MADFPPLPHIHVIAKLRLWVHAYNHEEKRIVQKL